MTEDAPPDSLAALDGETRRVLRDTIRIRLANGSPIREACAEARGQGLARESRLSTAEIDAAIMAILRSEDILTPEMIEFDYQNEDGVTYRPAQDEEVCATLVYSLRFDERGRPRKSGWDGLAKLGAMEMLKQLKASNFIVLKGPARRNHSTG
jgi:hypothetical protein